MTRMFFLTILIVGNSIMAGEKPNTLSRPLEGKYWTADNPNWLTNPTTPESQRENYYEHSDKIAETFATASNAGFFGAAAIAYKNNAPLSAGALILAGTVSALSHAIPYQSLNTLDHIGAAIAVMAVGYDAKLYTSIGLVRALSNPLTLFSLVTTGAIYALDVFVARSGEYAKKGLWPEKYVIARKSEHKWLHTLWHISAAALPSIILSNKED